MERILPAPPILKTFAVFKDDYNGQQPSPYRRYALFHYNGANLSRHYTSQPVTITESELLRPREMFSMIDSSFNVHMAWGTGYTVHANGIPFPVLDFEPRFVLSPADCLYGIVDDSPALCLMRMMEQKHLHVRQLEVQMGRTPPVEPSQLRNEIREHLATEMERIRAAREVTRPPTPVPPPLESELSVSEEPPFQQGPAAARLPAPPAGKLPRFVAEALKRDALIRKENCSISMSPLEECGTVAVTDCYHLFDAESLTDWLKRKPSCPLCKQPVAGLQVV